jgi:hypothetical protein
MFRVPACLNFSGSAYQPALSSSGFTRDKPVHPREKKQKIEKEAIRNNLAADRLPLKSRKIPMAKVTVVIPTGCIGHASILLKKYKKESINQWPLTTTSM